MQSTNIIMDSIQLYTALIGFTHYEFFKGEIGDYLHKIQTYISVWTSTVKGIIFTQLPSLMILWKAMSSLPRTYLGLCKQRWAYSLLTIYHNNGWLLWQPFYIYHVSGNVSHVYRALAALATINHNTDHQALFTSISFIFLRQNKNTCKHDYKVISCYNLE